MILPKIESICLKYTRELEETSRVISDTYFSLDNYPKISTDLSKIEDYVNGFYDPSTNFHGQLTLDYPDFFVNYPVLHNNLNWMRKETALPAETVRARQQNLIKIGIAHFMTFFEAFNKDFSMEIFTTFPEMLRVNSLAVTRPEVVSNDYDGIVRLLADKASKGMEKGIEEAKKVYMNKFSLDVGKYPKLAIIELGKQLRNDIVHHAGRVTPAFTRFFGNFLKDGVHVKFVQGLLKSDIQLGEVHVIEVAFIGKLEKAIMGFFRYVWNNWGIKEFPLPIDPGTIADAMNSTFSEDDYVFSATAISPRNPDNHILILFSGLQWSTCDKDPRAEIQFPDRPAPMIWRFARRAGLPSRA